MSKVYDDGLGSVEPAESPTLAGVLPMVRAGMVGKDDPVLARRLNHAFSKHRDAVRGLVRRELRGFPEAQVEDAVQDVMGIAWKKLAEHDGQRFRPWLFGIAVNVCRNHRKKKRDVLSADGELYDAASPAPSAYATLRAQEQEELLAEAARRVLESVDQEIVYMRYTLELPNAEIARLVGFADANEVRVRLIRTRNRLRRALDAVVAERGHTRSLVLDTS